MKISAKEVFEKCYLYNCKGVFRDAEFRTPLALAGCAYHLHDPGMYTNFKHFSRFSTSFVRYCSVFFFVEVISSRLMLRKQRNIHANFKLTDLIMIMPLKSACVVMCCATLLVKLSLTAAHTNNYPSVEKLA